MKIILLCFSLLLAVAAKASNIPINGQNLTPKTVNFFIHYPDNYDPARAEGYPVLFFLHGKGEKDTGGLANLSDGTLDMNVLNKVLRNGPPKLINNKSWDSSLPFIVVSPQSQTQSGGFSTNNFDPVFNYVMANTRVNPDKVYLTGLSQGGNSTYNIYRDRAANFAAIIPVAGWFSKTIDDCNAVKDVAVWAFHGDADTTVGFNSGVAAYNKTVACAPTHPPKFTAYENIGHNAWSRTYNNTMVAAYDINDASIDATKNIGGDGAYYKQDIYNWLLSFPSTNPSVNQPPVANAGNDQEITLPANSVVIAGSGTDSDGSVIAYQWLQVSGPSSATLIDANTATLSASNLTDGTYVFSLVVTDDDGTTDADTVSVLVNPVYSEPTVGSFLQVSNSGYGHMYLQYYAGQSNSSNSRVDVLSMGQDTANFYIKNISGDIDYNALYFGMMGGYQTRELQIAPYITSVGSDWAKVSIPLVDFAFDSGKLEQGVYHVKLRATSALGNGEFGLDEITFTGGNTAFLYYGDDDEASGVAGYSASGNGFEIIAYPESGGVSQANGAPVIAPIADVTLSEEEVATVNISATDADGLSLSIVNLPSFASFIDNGDTTGQLQLMPSTGDRGVYSISVVAEDTNGASSVLDFNVTVQPVDATGGFLQVANSGYGHIYMQYYFAQSNSDSARVDVLSMGHDTVEFSIKNISGAIDFNLLYFGMMGGYQTRELKIAPYITTIGSDWVKVSIPLNDFGFDPGKLESGVYHVKLRATSMLGSGQFGIDEIHYTGGTMPFVYYGDDYESSALEGYSSKGNGFEILERPESGGN